MSTATNDTDVPLVASREQLAYLLSEAAELEHGLMCSYLFAAFSLKRRGSDLTPDEVAAIARWRSTILTVAVEEMLHLCLVQNMLAAIGAAAHMQRPNFPIAPGLYPSQVVLDLARFSADTLEHFIFLERPEGSTATDKHHDMPHYERQPRVRGLTPSAQDYTTVGALYEGIERGFEELARKLAPAGLFIGDPSTQVERSLVDLEGLHAVTDVPSARRAIGRIIEQGEGGRRHGDDSHFDRFQRIQRELAELRERRPDFDPAHPVVTNPVMNAPADPSHCVHVDDPGTAVVLDLANAAYGLMVQLLAFVFSVSGNDAQRTTFMQAAIALMGGVIGPLAELLATLPASTTAPNGTAGMSFTLPRSTHALPRRRAASIVLHERATELAMVCAASSDQLAAIAPRVRDVAAMLAP